MNNKKEHYYQSGITVWFVLVMYVKKIKYLIIILNQYNLLSRLMANDFSIKNRTL